MEQNKTLEELAKICANSCKTHGTQIKLCWLNVKNYKACEHVGRIFYNPEDNYMLCSLYKEKEK